MAIYTLVPVVLVLLTSVRPEGLIDEARAVLNVDKRRIYVTGFSDGGFMSYRMACDHSDVIAAFASLGGRNWTNCSPRPVHALEIHGTADMAVPYNDAAGSIEQWAQANECIHNFSSRSFKP